MVGAKLNGMERDGPGPNSWDSVGTNRAKFGASASEFLRLPRYFGRLSA